MTSLKSLVLATVLLASGTSLALAQQPDNVVRTPGGSPAYTGTPGYTGAPAYTGPGYMSAPAAAPSRAPVTRHHGRMYMSAKPSHHKSTSGTNGGY